MGIHIGKGLSNLFHTVVSDVEKAGKKVGNAIADGAHQVVDTFEDGAGEAVGELERIGLQYPVSKYQSQVSPELTRGSRPSAADLSDLKARGFKGDVNLCLENNNDESPAKAAGLNELHVPILDNAHPSEAQVKQFLDFVSSPANQPCYVHCEAGKGRTGVMVACYRMAMEGWSAQAAIAEAKQFGLAMPNQIHFLEQFGNDLGAGKVEGYPKK